MTNAAESGEFALIDAMIDVLGDAARGAGVIVGPGDDAALLEIPAGSQLVVSTDTLVAGRHYPAAAAADLIGYRSMAVATSDLAAMGARPAWAAVSLTSDRLTAPWAQAFAAGVAAAAGDFAIAVVGGNVARGPQSVTVVVHGHLPAGQALLRSGAKNGDGIYVTGCLGGALLALADAALTHCVFAELDADSPLGRYWKPQPRIKAGMALRGIASAAIDISDGLSSDLAHLCRSSGVGARIDLDAVPAFAGCPALNAVSGGDDYELAFTAPAAADIQVRAAAAATGAPVTRIGIIAEEPAQICWMRGGKTVDVPRGYRHF